MIFIKSVLISVTVFDKLFILFADLDLNRDWELAKYIVYRTGHSLRENPSSS